MIYSLMYIAMAAVTYVLWMLVLNVFWPITDRSTWLDRHNREEASMLAILAAAGWPMVILLVLIGGFFWAIAAVSTNGLLPIAESWAGSIRKKFFKEK